MSVTVARSIAAPKPLVEITISLTPAQARVIQHASRVLRTTPNDFIAATACAETECWSSYGEFVEGVMPGLVRFIDKRRVPKASFTG